MAAAANEVFKMALGLNTLHITMSDFFNQLHRFDSVKLNDKNEFVCWIEGTCNFYVVDDVDDAELHAFAVSVAEEHAAQQIEKICEKCGSSRTTRSEHSSKAFDDREVKGELHQVEIIERYIVYRCGECRHSRAISF